MAVASEQLSDDQKASVRAAVSRLIASGALGAGARRARLFEYLVEAKLRGRAGELKAYSIGVDVLGRADDFDPSVDSIVRVEVARLRDALALYHATKGASSPVCISIPKGAYVPEFSFLATPQSRLGGKRRRWAWAVVSSVAVVATIAVLVGVWSREVKAPDEDELFSGVRVLIEPIAFAGSHGSAERLAIGMHAELLSDLSAFPWIAAISYPHNSRTRPPELAGDPDLIQDYLLSGEVFWDEAEVHALFKLLDLESYEVVWSKAFETEATGESLEDAQHELANSVVDHIARIHGVAPHLARNKNALISGASLEAYLCFMGLYEYWKEPTDTRHRDLRDCMEHGLTEHPQAGHGWAALTFLYMDESRQGLNPRDGRDPWEDAERSAELAMRYAPLEALSLNAAMTLAISKPNPDHEAFEAHARTLLNSFPRNAFSLANVGSKFAIKAGNWDVGVELTNQAFALNPHPPDWYYYVPAFHALLLGESTALDAALEQMAAHSHKEAALLRLVQASAHLDQPGAASRAEDLATLGISGLNGAHDYIREFRFEPRLSEVLLTRVAEAYEFVGPAATLTDSDDR